MNELIKQLSQDKTVWWSTLLSITIIMVSILLVLVYYQSLPPLIPLFNQLPWGADRLSAKINLLLPIALSFIILIGNTTLIKYIYEKMGITTRMLAITTLLIAVLTCIFTIRIIQMIL